MNPNYEEIKSSLNQVLAVNPLLGALVQVRPQDKAPITMALGSLVNAQSAEPPPRFPIYSIAKTLLAIFTLKLTEQDKLNLNDPAVKYLKRPVPDWMKEVTIRSLLSHRSGLFDYGYLPEYHQMVKKNPGRAGDVENFISQVFAKGPQFALNTSFGYSNIGYILIKEIAESVSGKNLQALFDEFVGSKLKIEMNLLQGTSEKIMAGYSPYLSEQAPDVRGLYDFSWVFHATFLSGLSELTQLFSNFDKILSPASIAEMANLHRLEFSHPEIHPSYGLGLMGDIRSKMGPVYGHNGGGPGFSVAAYMAPQKRVSIAAVVNNDSGVEAEKLVFETLKRL